MNNEHTQPVGDRLMRFQIAEGLATISDVIIEKDIQRDHLLSAVGTIRRIAQRLEDMAPPLKG